MHFSGISNYRKCDRHRVRNHAVLGHTPESFTEVVCLRRRRAQGIQRRPPFLHGLREPSRQLFHGSPHSDGIGGRLQRIIGNQLAALDGLEEGVVKFSSNPRPFVNPFLETKFKDFSRYRPGKEHGDGKSRYRHRRYENKDSALHASHVSLGS